MKRILILSLVPLILSATPPLKLISAIIISEGNKLSFECHPTVCDGKSIHAGNVSLYPKRSKVAKRKIECAGLLTYLLMLELESAEEENHLTVEYSLLRGDADENSPETIKARKVMPLNELITEDLIFKNDEAIQLNLQFHTK